MKRGICWACFLLCGSASAQEGVHWQYSAPPECPSEQQFRDLVRARLLDEPQASESGPNASNGNRVSVEVRLEPSLQRATLLLREPDLTPVERVVHGESCEELASGLALITALAFGGAREPPPATPSTEPGAVAKADTPAPAPQSPPPPAKPMPTPRGEGQRGDASSPRVRAPALAVALGAGGWVNTWSAPRGELGTDLFVRVAPQADRSWSLRAAALYGFGAADVGDRRAELRFFGGRAEGCPISHARTWLSAEGCLGLELGALRGRGRASSALLVGASDTV
ncbi:MAG: hypothetical protein ABW061_20925, partial [Polyangiaceae bacterium]